MSETREVVSTFTYKNQPHWEVEQYKPQTQTWTTLKDVQTDSKLAYHFDSDFAAMKYAEDHGKLYHVDTRVVKVSP